MKRFTTLMTVCCLLVMATKAQFLPPTKDVFKKHTQPGSVLEVAPYGDGMVYISNDGTNDIISYTTDGITFTDAESLNAGSVKSLIGWQGSEIAFYLGDNASDAVGIDLRKLDGGTSSYIYNHNPLGDANQKLLTGVGRFYNGTAYEYHYLYQFDADMFGAPQASHNITTGADGDTPIEITPSEFGIQDASLYNSKMFGASFNGFYYYAAKNATMFGGYAALYRVISGSVEMIHKLDVDIASIYGLTTTTNHLYFLSGNYGDFGDALLYVTDLDNNTSLVTANSGDVMVDDAIQPQVLNDKLYCIAQFGTGHKLAEINGTTVKFFHLNDEEETDNITDMVISGDYVYVIAAKTGEEPQLFAINPSRGDAAYVNAIDPVVGYNNDFSMLTAINGGVAFIDTDGSNDYIIVTDGNDGNTKKLMIEGSPAPTLDIQKIHSTGDKLFAFSNNGTDTEIYEYIVSAFATQVEEVTITEFGTGNAIEGVTVRFDTGLESFSAVTDATGKVTLNDVPKGYIDVTVTKSGYARIETEYYVGGMFPAAYELTPAKNFAFVIYDASIYDPLYVGWGSNGELEGASVELSDGSNTYSAVSVMGGFADFYDVYYGTYDYTVSMSGYTTASGTFTVDENTLEGEKVTLNPIPTSIEKTGVAQVKVYPNPVVDILNIESENEISKVEIYSVSGSLVKSVTTHSITNIAVADLAKGVYLVRTTDASGKQQIIKINKN